MDENDQIIFIQVMALECGIELTRDEALEIIETCNDGLTN